MFAKLGSDYNKPDAVTVIDRGNFRDIVWPLPAEELLYVGRSTRVRLAALGIHTIGDIARTEERVLKLRLGKMGEVLHAYANGLDNSPVLREGEYAPAKSVGNGTTTPRTCSLADAMPVVVSLCECRRAAAAHWHARGVLTLELRSPELHWISHRRRLEAHTDCDRELVGTALSLLARRTAGRTPCAAWPCAPRSWSPLPCPSSWTCSPTART
ncbi:MAG: DNA polymerase thumb domain-containing protein [Oscillospiraceae bacterium]